MALASSALYVIAFPGQIGVFWPLAFVALVPVLFALRAQSPRRALVIALAFGLPTHVVGFRWLLPLLVTFSGFPAVICGGLLVGFALLQTSRFLLWFGVSAWISRRSGRFLLPFVLAFGVTEALVPVAFEWRFAAALDQVPLLQQSADVIGSTGVGAVLVLVNVAVFEALRARRRFRERARGAVETGAIALLLSVAYGIWARARTDAVVAGAERLTVGLLQGNVPLAPHPSEEEGIVQRQLVAHRALEDAGVDLVVWSEGALPSAILLEGLDNLLVDRLAGGPRVPTFVGAIVVDADAEGTIRPRNSAILADRGRVIGRYDKQVLLPFSEYLPLGERFPALYAASPASGRFTPGTSRAPLVARGHRFGVLICYEDVLPGLVRETVAEGAEILVNLTNDAWFGDSAEPYAHLALAKLRAIENRRFLIRATNTGVSAIVDPAGRITATGPSFVPTVVRGEARYLTGRTLFNRVGEAPWLAAAALLAWLAILPRGRQVTPRQGDQPDAPAGTDTEV